MISLKHRCLILLAFAFCVSQNSMAQMALKPVALPMPQPNTVESNAVHVDLHPDSILGTRHFSKKNRENDPLSMEGNYTLDMKDTLGAKMFLVGRDSLAMYCKTDTIQGRKGKKKVKHYCWIPEMPEAVEKPVKVSRCHGDCHAVPESKDDKKDKRTPHERDVDREHRSLFRQAVKGLGWLAGMVFCARSDSCPE